MGKGTRLIHNKSPDSKGLNFYTSMAVQEQVLPENGLQWVKSDGTIILLREMNDASLQSAFNKTSDLLRSETDIVKHRNLSMVEWHLKLERTIRSREQLILNIYK